MLKSSTFFRDFRCLVFLSFLFPFYLLGAPVVTSLSLHSGPTTGGQSVTITGSGFTGVTSVNFGTQMATINTANDTAINVTTPASVPIVVDVQVSVGSAISAINQFDRYAFQGNWLAFIPDFGSNNAFTSNTSTMIVNPTPLIVGNEPNDICVTSDGEEAYVVNSGSNDITPIDVLTLTPGSPIPTSANFPILMALTQDPINGHQIGYTANYLTNTISQIDLTAQTVLQVLPVGLNPCSGAVVMDFSTSPPTPLTLYVTNSSSSNISIISLSTFQITTIDTGAGSIPSFICISIDGTTAYFTDDNPSLNSVRQILNVNTASPVFGLTITDASFNFQGQNLFPQIALSPDGNNLYVTNTGSNTISFVDLNTFNVCPITVQFGPNGMAITPDGKTVYVCNSISNAISIVSNLPSCLPDVINLLVGTLPTDPSITPDQAPLAYFTATPSSANPNQLITFDPVLSASPVGSIASYHWDFGDGNFADTLPANPSITHVYPLTGNYTVTLTVVNTAGTSTSSTFAYNGKQTLRNGGPSALFALPITIAPLTNIPTTTFLTSSPSSSTGSIGDIFTFNALVSASVGTPTGFVQFSIDGNPVLPPSPISFGMANFTHTFDTGGTYIVRAQYLGNDTYSPSLSNPLTKNISLATSTTTISSSDTTCAPYGEPLTFTSTVTTTNIPSGIPTGTVLFEDISTNPVTIFGGGILNNLGIATYTTNNSTALTVGTHQILAVYSGDSNHESSDSQVLIQEICPADTTTHITSSLNPSTYGDTITFFATITPIAPGQGFPTGLVQFSDGMTILGSGYLYNGQTQFTVFTPLSVGPHTITAVYMSDGSYNSSNDSLVQQVNPIPTTTTIISSPNPSYYGQLVTLAAQVAASSGNPTGSVQFIIDGVNYMAPVLLNGAGQANISVSNLSVMVHTIMAQYINNTNIFSSSNRSGTQTVLPLATTTILVSSLNPAFYGDAVTFTANVNSSSSFIPTGTITFNVNGVLGSPIPLVNGVASFSTANLPLGFNTIIAIYSGDSQFSPSTSLSFIERIINTLAPKNLRICQQRNHFATQTEYENIISGRASASPLPIVEFRIYRDSQLTVLAGVAPAQDNRFTFVDHNRMKGVVYTYYIVSINTSGTFSDIGVVSN